MNTYNRKRKKEKERKRKIEREVTQDEFHRNRDKYQLIKKYNNRKKVK